MALHTLKSPRDLEMAQGIKVQVTPEAHVKRLERPQSQLSRQRGEFLRCLPQQGGGENWFLQVSLVPPHMCSHVHTSSHVYTHTNKSVNKYRKRPKSGGREGGSNEHSHTEAFAKSLGDTEVISQLFSD